MSVRFDDITVETKVSLPALALQNMYQEVKEIIGKGKLDSSNIVNLVINLMQVVESYDNVSGKEKKALILTVLENVINDSFGNNEKANNLNFIVRTVLPGVIDSLVSVDKKQLQIKLKKGWKKLCCC